MRSKCLVMTLATMTLLLIHSLTVPPCDSNTPYAVKNINV